MARRRRGSGGGEHGAPSNERWLLTYSDMITLLLALFILLYAMSTINPHRFDEVRRSLSSEFHGQVISGTHDINSGSTSIMSATEADDTSTQTFVQQQQESTQHEGQQIANQSANMQQHLAQALGSANNTHSLAAHGVQVTLTSEGITIRLAGDTFFDSGSATLKSEALTTLDAVAKQLKHVANPLSVEGHTDGQPISTGEFPSNLVLSTARADAVAGYLNHDGIADYEGYGSAAGKIARAMGYGDAKPIVKPPYPTANEPKNRTVDIVLIAPSAAAQAAVNQANGGSQGIGAEVAQQTNPAGTSQAPVIDNPIGDVIGLAVHAGGS